MRMWTRAAARALVVVAVASSAACRKEAGQGDRPDSAAASPVDRHATAMPALSWRLASPPSWDDRVRVVDDAEGAARLAALGIHTSTLFQYLPRDTSAGPQALLGVYVYDSTAWARAAGGDGGPPGEVVERGPGVVYVASLPRSNPFGARSADSSEFAKRTIDMAYLQRAFRVVR
ncbi:MAG: hypothetical protein IT359_14440 [Gemmatimonadaceae bacterium]|nr:hypothetical protein [Gemmatimonadaceae bacterium]